MIKNTDSTGDSPAGRQVTIKESLILLVWNLIAGGLGIAACSFMLIGQRSRGIWCGLVLTVFVFVSWLVVRLSPDVKNSKR